MPITVPIFIKLKVYLCNGLTQTSSVRNFTQNGQYIPIWRV